MEYYKSGLFISHSCDLPQEINRFGNAGPRIPDNCEHTNDGLACSGNVAGAIAGEGDYTNADKSQTKDRKSMHDTDYRGCKITRHTDGQWEANCVDLLGVGIEGNDTANTEAEIHAFVDGLYQRAEKKLATLKDLAAKVKEDQSALDGILLSTKDIGQKAIAKAREIGKSIKEARGLTTKGQWMKWLENETGLKYQTARKYVKIAEVAPEHLDGCTSLMDAYYFLGLDKPRTNRTKGKKKPQTETETDTDTAPDPDQDWDEMVSDAVQTILGAIDETGENAAEWLGKVQPIIEVYFQVKECHDEKTEEPPMDEAA